MPFTLSHVAAALPLRRSAIPFSALAIGCMAPDFVYFFDFAPGNQQWHNLPALFTGCLPAGLIMLFLYEYLLKAELIKLFPHWHEVRLAPLAAPKPLTQASTLSLAALGILVGAFTHIVWDSFTHGYGWSVSRLTMLQTYLLTVREYEIHVHNLLQHLSTFFGAVVLAAYYGAWIEKQPASDCRSFFTERQKLQIVGLLWLFAFTAALTQTYAAYWRLAQPPIPFHAFAKFVVSTGTYLFFGVLIYSIASRLCGRS